MIPLIRPTTFQPFVCVVVLIAVLCLSARAGDAPSTLQHTRKAPAQLSWLDAELIRLYDSRSALSRNYLLQLVSRCTEALHSNSSDSKVYHVRGLAYWRLEETKSARQDLEKLLAMSPPQYPEFVYCILAECYSDEGNFDAAIIMLTRGMKTGRMLGELCLRRAQAYSQIKKYKEALADADRVVALNPGRVFPFALRAKINLNAGNYEKSVSDYSQCLKVEPRNERLYAERAQAYAGLGKKSLADADRKMRDSLIWDIGK